MTKHDEAARRILEQHGAPANDPHGAALVHATLYLAEQQRLANLIALADMRPEIRDQGVALDALRVGVAGEVWEGLGLT